MKKFSRLAGAVAAAALVICFAAGCAGKKGETGKHFGTEVNHPKFKGAGDFFKSYFRAVGIMSFKRLDGEPVDTGWIEPAFREKLCLVVTINNHCVA